MISRRKFLAGSVVATSGLLLNQKVSAAAEKVAPTTPLKGKPIIISTWRHGLPANEVAAKILVEGGRSLDAVEAGARVPEADPNIMTVGLGGYPDRDGYVTLDACIMDEKGNAGSVTFLQDIVHPVSVARKVMEDTPHVMLSGEGALQFALEKGFKKQNLLTDKAKEAWEEWKKKSKYEPVINIENHDTISMLAIDANGDLSGACTTSGAAFKMHGRVGDSPIIGAGLFCDNEVGGAASTGMGELVMKTVGSFLVVELMRNGMSPQKACEEAVHRIAKKIPGYQKFQIGYIAINKAGETGAYCIHPGFNYALWKDGQNTLTDAESLFKK
ncbi:isoaspartyl peptidase/L-asparaginase family protein [Prolixibacter denitrificans]|uniref:Asparaginase n=1 Tax=Prolixibacter denitrificans TaxID=1541063 RepID=A0A2P8CGC5_9BACT|nr:N(4)-(beta-N-acetylglucosaminyl)-L-asparaginase [Prolixibacter denitrificans]PSK83976.1 L-asparaginase/N4-(beta-N-acetylglucosaminyl)-L-asparaginase [Prolixibacter denitrificans]GET23518.1 asparaginase [Prolixibacter denitrificans]